jgi:hypothetical protein
MQPLGSQGMCGLHTAKKALCEAQRLERKSHGIVKQLNGSSIIHPLMKSVSARCFQQT